MYLPDALPDPSVPQPGYSDYLDSRDLEAPSDLQGLLETQLQIAHVIQQAVLRDRHTMSARDLKDLSGAASSLIALSHRTEKTLQAVTTYRVFVGVVFLELTGRLGELAGEIIGDAEAPVGGVEGGIERDHCLEVGDGGGELTEEQMTVTAARVERRVARRVGQRAMQGGALRAKLREHRRALGGGERGLGGESGSGDADGAEKAGDE